MCHDTFSFMYNLYMYIPCRPSIREQACCLCVCTSSVLVVQAWPISRLVMLVPHASKPRLYSLCNNLGEVGKLLK